MGLRPSWAPLAGFGVGQCLPGCPPIPSPAPRFLAGDEAPLCRPHSRGRALGPGSADPAWRGPPGGGADGHLRPDQGRGQSQCAAGPATETQVRPCAPHSACLTPAASPPHLPACCPAATRVTRRTSPSPATSRPVPWAPCWGITTARAPRATPTSPSPSLEASPRPGWRWSER